MTYNNRHRTAVNSSGRQKKNADWRGKIWNSNIFSLILIVLLISSFIKVSKEVLLRYEINQEIKHLEAQLDELNDSSTEMDNLIAYLKTDEYIEKEARLKLNLSKPGEKQINLSSDFENNNISENTDNTPNMIRWFNYFFK